MKKIFLSVLFSPILYAQTISSDYDLGSYDAVFRAYHVFAPSYVVSGREEDYAVDGSTIGGHLRYHSPEYVGVGVSTALYYSMGTGLNNKDDTNTIMATGRFFTKDYSPRAVLGELNIHYVDDTQRLIFGNFKIDSPLTNSIYTYMQNMFYFTYNDSGDAKILNAWDGDPSYTSSIFSRNAYKVGYDYQVTRDMMITSSYAYYGQSTTMGTFVPSRPLEALSLPDTDTVE